ncbi:MAG: large conductance mechanosensitive channel [Candidatus Azotimanducaceae bacterium]
MIYQRLSLLPDDVSIIDRKYIFRAAEEKSKEVLISYNELIEILIDITIFTLTIFIVIKFINRFNRKAQALKNKAVKRLIIFSSYLK